MIINTILLGAGNSVRMKDNLNKVFKTINNKYIIEYSIDIFIKIKEITKIIVLYNKKDINIINNLRNKYPSIVFKEGDVTRINSLKKGLDEIDNNATKVIIHDGARPLIDLDIIKNMIKESKKSKALIPVLPANESIKITDNNYIVDSINRDKVVFCQTPQIYEKNIAMKIKNNKNNQGVVTYLLSLNVPLKIYKLEKSILKITTIDDFYYYEYLLERKKYEKD